ncbi:polysaccharide ABC transporter ATP-binding protein [Hyphomicrobium sp.]|uniref:ABC transporter ATP-binding protein n=1 Tax=Hyphomicrobium sp. TaxID=82 RepID=UPI000FAD552F|nr:MAG: ATP-binding cassette domain-containing protein [Hyphomicrobium sp.]
MDTSVIRVEGLSKRYSIARQRRDRYKALRDVISSAAKSGLRMSIDALMRKSRAPSAEFEEFWALRDVSFRVSRGDVVGIVGRNGAGKSTLLKVLSRITDPTQGRVSVRGRIASLLEVGTGFHPELTGRENIYLNGAILGMRHAEIRRKFDEIVSFAEVERFLDTPVKRYSSGMYVRLAFAVAAHLEPEILVVDEVLAVGDKEFQQKCLGKMKNVAGEGRTVLFVSHNLAAVRSLCNRALLMSGGEIVIDAPVDAVIRRYISSNAGEYSVSFAPNDSRPSISFVRVDRDGLCDRSLVIEIGFVSPRPLQTAVRGVVLRADTGEPVWGSNSRFHPSNHSMKGFSVGSLRCEAKGLPLSAGTYHISAWLADWHEDLDSKLDVLSIAFGEDASDHLRPPVSALGHLDWPASWRVMPSEAVSAA